ncbi:MAG: hypothetical protein L0154_10585 [Chloroflexi bacterium]|nr:hypothetical protein [Chloroflexota bacterium]
MVRRLLLILLILAALHSQTRAQQPERVLVWVNGDFAWYSLSLRSLTPISTSGQNDFPVISPDGTTIAYRTIPPDAVELLEDADELPAQLPNDIFLIDLSTQVSEAITRQPTAEDEIIIRSRPGWSPDGRYLVWAEVRMPGEVYVLVMHDMDTEQAQEVNLTLSPQSTQPAPPAVIPGQNAIAVEDFEFVEDDEVAHIQYRIYDYAGSFLTTLIPREQPTEEDYFPRAALWIQDGSSEVLGVIFDSAVWHLMSADSQREYVGSIDLISPSGASLPIFFTEVDGNMRFVVDMPLNPDAAMVSLDRISLGENGEWFAYIIPRPDRTVWVGPTGNSIMMGEFDAVVGSYPRWRLP